MKKVLFTATVDSHIINFHIPYLKWFKENGYEVHVATNGEDKIPFCDVKHKVSFERNPLKINNIKAIRQLKKIIEKEKCEIIHCHTPMGSVVTRLATMKARKKYNVKVIYTAHGFHFYKGAPLINWMIYYPIEKWLSKCTDCLITINKEDYNLAKRKFRTKQIELVHGVGVDENKFKNIKINKEEKLKELDLQSNKKIVITVAELTKGKNHETIIRAIKDMDNVYYLICGEGKLENYLKELVNQLGMKDKVIFLGFRKDINELLSISDLFVFPSYREGLPVAVMEAMFVGVPILASNIRGITDLITDDKYLISANDVEKYKYCIEELLSNKEICNKVIEDNSKNINTYSLQNIENEMKKIYNNVKS